MRKKQMRKSEAIPSLKQMMNEATEQAIKLAASQQLIGTATYRDGVLVLPVSKVTVGVSGGSADGVPTGVGVKVEVTPISALSVSGKKVKAVPVGERRDPLASLVKTVQLLKKHD